MILFWFCFLFAAFWISACELDADWPGNAVGRFLGKAAVGLFTATLLTLGLLL